MILPYTARVVEGRMNPGALRQLLSELIDCLRPYHLLFAGVLLLVLLIGGVAPNAEVSVRVAGISDAVG